jgi:hypothetical protein
LGDTYIRAGCTHTGSQMSKYYRLIGWPFGLSGQYTCTVETVLQKSVLL